MASKVTKRLHSFRTSVCFIAIAGSIAFWSVPASHAQGVGPSVNIGMDFSATLGLDEATRRMIEALPENIRRQIYTLAIQVLPEVDKSVHSYLDKVHNIVLTSMAQAQCQIIGSGQAITEVGSGFVRRMFGINAPALVISELGEYIALRRGEIKSTDSAARISHLYADLAYAVAVQRCKVGPIAPTSLAVLQTLDVSIHNWAMLWVDLAGRCDTAASCYRRRLEDLRLLVASADPRDRDRVNAQQRIAEVPLPPAEPSWPGLLFSQFNLDEHETKLLTLRRIHLDLLAARLVRIRQGRRFLEAAKLQLEDVEASLNVARSTLNNRPSLGGMRGAKSRGRQAHQNLLLVTANLAAAITFDENLRPSVETLHKQQHGLDIIAITVACTWSGPATYNCPGGLPGQIPSLW